MRRVVDLLPRATSTDARGISRFVGWADAPVAVDLGSVDLTSSLTSSQRLHAFYAFQRDRRQEPLETGSTVPGFGDVRVGRRQLLTLEHTRTVGSGRVHQTRLGVSGIAFEAEAASALNPADFGLDVGHTRASGLPAFTVPGAFNLGGPVNFPQGRTDQTIVVSHVAGVGFGRHSLKIGGEYRHFTYETRTLDSGAFTFPSVSAFVDGVANSFNVRLGDRAARILQPAVGAFLQDTFRLDPRLTLDLGLRYEWNVTPTEKENRLVVFDPATVSLLRIGVHKEAVYRQNRNAEPRVGVAWDPIGDGRTLLRSAYSVTVEQPLVNTVAQLASNPPLGTVLAITGAIAVESAFGLATAGGLSPITVDPAYRNSSVHAWNVNVQHEIDAGVTLMVAYVATKGSDLRLSRNINQPVDGLRPYRALSELSPILPGTLLGNITQVESSGRSQYRAVWTSLSKRLTRGLAFSASYTWSRSQDTNSQSTPPTAITVQNGYDLDDSWGPSDFDARHRYAVRANYELPLRSHAVVRGWQVAAVLQGQSGNPLNIVTNNATLTGVPNTVRPNVTGPIEIVGDLNRWFNPSVFVAVNEFGNLSRNAVVGPRFDTLDVSLAKTTRIGTRVRAMLQVDAFNVLNVRNYGQPGRVVGSPTFGVITNTRFPPGDSGSSRQVQLSARVYF